VPHLTLEYSANLPRPADLPGILVELEHLIADVGAIRLENFKSRAIRREVFAVGAGEGDRGFVHLEIAMFGGRTPEIKAEIGKGCLAVLGRRFPAFEGGPAVEITAEIREIDREGYFKSERGTVRAGPAGV
jgi:5-carboxymethyl-2-hydroxymuconate isomerase